jgi:serine/threonine-protein kinase
MAVLAALGVLAVVALGVGLALARNDDDPQQPTAPTVAMPKVTSLTEEEARARLEDQGFKQINAGAPVEDEDCPETPTVVRQNPAPNTQIRTDQPVTYQLCKGPNLVRVPADLEGSTEQAARQALQAADLVADVRQTDSDRPAGQVLEVEKAGQQVEPGTTITVRVSRGNLIEVPNVENRTQEAAQAILSNQGFNVDVRTVQREGTPGTVVAQDPAAGEKRKKGSKVTITVIEAVEPNPDDSEDPNPDDSSPPPGSGGGTGDDSGGGLLG